MEYNIRKNTEFRGECLLLLGAGSIASTFVPMLLENIDVSTDQILVVSADQTLPESMESLRFLHIRLTPENYIEKLGALVGSGDCIVNLSGGVSAKDLSRFCLENAIDYIDTSNERWEHGAVYNDSADFAQQWSQMISGKDKLPKSSTALVSHGANPGLVSHFAKQAVHDLALIEGLVSENEAHDWPDLARKLNLQAIHISEQDTQVAGGDFGSDYFCNTWSVEGLIEEAHSRPCFAFGSHEIMVDGIRLRNDPVCRVGSFQGFAKHCKTRSWLPSVGEFESAIIPHEETFSIAELFSDKKSGYQPTVLFAYCPCANACDTLYSSDDNLENLRPHVLTTEITRGNDELGVLLLREGLSDVYWFGSTLDIGTARSLVPCANATSVQVAAGVLGGLAWVLENPELGLVSAEDADHEYVLRIARPYLGDLRGVHGRWKPVEKGWSIAELLL